jgi:hypothetical protein
MKRESIINKLKERLQLIKIGNNYNTNAGKYVSVWEGNPFQLNDVMKYRIDIRDTEGARIIDEVQHSDSLHTHLLTVIINIVAKDNPGEIRKILADINKAIWTDRTFNDTAQNTYLVTNDINEVEHQEEIYIQGTTIINIQYRTAAGEI